MAEAIHISPAQVNKGRVKNSPRPDCGVAAGTPAKTEGREIEHHHQHAGGGGKGNPFKKKARVRR